MHFDRRRQRWVEGQTPGEILTHETLCPQQDTEYVAWLKVHGRGGPLPPHLAARRAVYLPPRVNEALEFIRDKWEIQGRLGVLPSTTATVNTLAAEVNDGRWIVRCPNLSCNGAMAGEPSHPFFMCDNCWNSTNAGQWFAVVFPANRVAIEVSLLRRPEMRNRNWNTGETVADLERENLEHGIV